MRAGYLRLLHLVLISFFLSTLLPHPANAQSPGMPDPTQAIRAGVPIVPGQAVDELLPNRGVFFPFTPLDRDPTEGLRHGWVQTTSGKFGFRMPGLSPPSRVALSVGLLYDAGLLSSLPGIPYQEPRTSYDLGPNWLFTPVSALLPTGATTMILLTDQGGVVPYQKESGGTRYLPAPDRPSEFGPAEPTGDGGYRVTMSRGLKRTYRTVPGEGNYWLVKEEDQSGNALNFTYYQGLLQKISSTDGSWVEVYRPQWGESAPSGTPVRRIVRAKDSWGRELRFGFNSAGQLTSITDPDGQVWTISWDTHDHIANLRDPLARDVFSVSTDHQTHKTTSLTLFDVVTTFSYSVATNGTGQTTVTAADGGIFRYDFDAKGNTTKLTDAEGGITLFSRSTTTNDLTQVTEPTGGVHQFQHDAQHRVTQYTGPTVDGVAPIWTFFYDSGGRLIRTVAPLGAATVLTYDAAGRLISEAVDPNADGTAEAVTSYTRDAVKGDVLSRTDPVGRVTNYSYNYQLDAVTGNLASVTTTVKPPCLGTICPEFKYERSYDATTNEVVDATKWPTGAGTWSTWQVRSSRRGDLRSIKNPLGSSWSYAANAAGTITSVTHPAGGVWQYQWRADGKLTRVEDPLGNVTRWEYNIAGLPIRRIDPNNQTWLFEFDKLGRLKQRQDPAGRIWRQTYDLSGRLASWEAPGSRLITIVRDAAGRMTRRNLPGGIIERFTWDLRGNLTAMEQETPGSPSVTLDRWELTWDGRGLPLTAKSILAGMAAPPTSTWVWNSAGELTSWTDYGGISWGFTRDAWGRPTAVSAGTQANTAEYEPWSGRLTRRTHAALNSGEPALEERYEYDAANRVVKFSEYEGATLARAPRFTLDAEGRITQIFDETGAQPLLLANYVWDQAGRILSSTAPSGAQDAYVWSKTGQLVQHHWVDTQGATGSELFSYDVTGLPLTTQSSDGAVAYEWDYTPSDQSLGAVVTRTGTGDQSTPISLAYDPEGRIRQVKSFTNGNWTERRRYRWMPGALATVSSVITRGADGALTHDFGFLWAAGPPSARFDIANNMVDWRANVWQSVNDAESGGWRRLIPGRALGERDESRLVATLVGPEADVMSRVLGGVLTRAGIELPRGADLTMRPRSPGVPTVADNRLIAQLPNPRFRDAAWGLPTTPTADDQVRAFWLPPGGEIEPGMEVCEVSDRVKSSVYCRAMTHRFTHHERYIIKPLNGIIPLWKQPKCVYCDMPRVGVSGPTCADGGRSQDPEPIRNADQHSLGVTLSNGEYTLQVDDVTIPGAGRSLVLGRAYRSQAMGSGILGRGWFMPLLEETLMAQPCDGNTRWNRGDGSSVPLTTPADPNPPSNGPFGTKLRKFSTGTGSSTVWWWEIREADGTIRKFRDIGSVTTQWAQPTAHLVRVSRPGSPIVVIDWREPQDEPANEHSPTCPAALKPLRVRLLNCDDDPENNPSGAGSCPATPSGNAIDPKEVGRFEFETVRDCAGWRITGVLIKQVFAGAWATRKLSYSYKADSDSAGNVIANYLTGVSFSDVDAGTTAEAVASYKYGFEETPSSVHPWLRDNLVELSDGSGQWVQKLTYTPIGTQPLTYDTVQSIQTRSRTLNLTYTVQNLPIPGAPELHRERIGETVLSSSGRTTHHLFDANGHPIQIVRPNGSTIVHEYAVGGALTKTTYADGHSERYVYGPSRYGIGYEEPIKVGVYPAAGSNEAPQWTCVEPDYLTGGTYRTLSAEGISRDVNGDSTVDDLEPPCNFTTGTELVPHASETISGWMLTANGSGTQLTTDTNLQAYFDRWDIKKRPEDDARPVVTPVSGETAWPWWSVKHEKSRAATKGMNSSGAIVTLTPPERSTIRYLHAHPQGRVTSIERPDGGSTVFTYLAPGEAGPAAGSASGLGMMAQQEEVGESTVPRTRWTYNKWGNVIEEQRLLDTGVSAPGAERWLVAAKQYDFRSRLIWEAAKTGDTAGPSIETRYHYNSQNRLDQKRIETTAALGATKSWALVEFSYTPVGLLEKEIAWERSPSGPTNGPWDKDTSAGSTERRLSYDQWGNVTEEAQRLSSNSWRITRHSYNDLDQRIRTDAYASAGVGTDPPANPPGGKVVTSRTWFDSAGRAIWTQTYGTGGPTDNVVSTGRVEYDGLSRVWRQTACLSAAAAKGVDPPICESADGANRKLSQTEQRYDRENRLVDERVSAERIGGSAASFAFVSWAMTEFDERGRVINKRAADSATLPVPICTSGGRETICDAIETHTAYDSLDRAVKVATPKSAGGWVVTETEFDKRGWRKLTKDPLTNESTVVRNALGLATERTVTEKSLTAGLPALDKKAVTTRFEYDDLGRPKAVKLQDPQNPSVTNRTITRQFDARGNVVAEWLPLGAAALGDAWKTTYQYDGLNRKIRERRHIKAADATSDGWQDVRYIYDAASRLSDVDVEPDGTAQVPRQRTHLEYDAQGRRVLRSKRDQSAQNPQIVMEERTIFDGAGRVSETQWVQGGGGCTLGVNCVSISVGYDNASRRTGLTTGNIPSGSALASHYGGTQQQFWDYDGLGRALRVRDDNGAATTADWSVVNYEYDSLSRVTKESFGDGDNGSRWPVVTTYDKASREATLSYPAFGSSPAGLLSYAFDDLGRLTALYDGPANQPNETIITNGFVGATRLVKTTYADGSSWRGYDSNNVTYWDHAGRRTRGQVWGTTNSALFDEEIHYDANDDVTAVLWAHGRTSPDKEAQIYKYDETGRLIEQRQGKWYAGPSNDPDTVGSGSELTAGRSWQLDELGNWRSHDDQKDTQGAFSPQVNLVNFYTTWPAFIDSNADGVPDTTLTLSLEQDVARGFLYKRQENATQYLYYKHDVFGRLIEVSRGDATVPQTLLARYGYFADGRLAWRQEGASGARERLVYDGAQPLLQGVDNPTADSWTFVWAGSSLVKSTRRQTVAGSPTMVVTYPHQDRQGSIVLQTRLVNNTVQTYGHAVYDPYGRPSTTPSWGTNSVDVPFGYTGARREDAVGLYLMGARWYDPVLGRFLEEDPIGEAGGLNTYAYVGSSPVSWVDPSGLSRRSTAGSSQMVWGGGHRSLAGMDSWSRVSASDAGGLPRSGGFEPNRDDRHELFEGWLPWTRWAEMPGPGRVPNPSALLHFRMMLERARSQLERNRISQEFENDPESYWCPMCEGDQGDDPPADGSGDGDDGAGTDAPSDGSSKDSATSGAGNVREAIRLMNETEPGREALGLLKLTNTKIQVNPDIPDGAANYEAAEGVINVNPSTPPVVLSGLIVHEAQHAAARKLGYAANATAQSRDSFVRDKLVEEAMGYAKQMEHYSQLEAKGMKGGLDAYRKIHATYTAAGGGSKGVAAIYRQLRDSPGSIGFDYEKYWRDAYGRK